jgi:hypothetical protein
MHLTGHEIKRFYNIWFALLYYVNQHRQLVPSFPQTWSRVSPEFVFPLRKALWQEDRLREAFIAENPAHLPTDDLALVESWKHRLEDKFFIFRHLKKYTIFINSGSPAQGYGVLGLTDSVESVVGPDLPIYVEAVLIPFEDQIIYDSLLAPYAIHFGGGYRRSLADTYRDIQERGGLITTLPDKEEDNLNKIKVSNKKVLAAFQKALAQSGLSLKMIQEHTQNLTDFADSFLNQQMPPVMLLDISQQDIKFYQSSRDHKINLVSFKRFVWFLRDTGRMDWDKIEDVLGYLKHQQS